VKIAVIGAGQVGGTLGNAWQRRGHDISYGVPNPDDPKYASLGAATTTNEEAARAADIVVLCTPWRATRDAVQACGDLAGKPLIGHTTSGAEQVAGWAPGARVCKAINQIGAPMMDAPALPGAPVMFVCGDDEAAKKSTIRLVEELGFEVVDAGELTVARVLEPFGLLWIHLALRRGFGTNWGFGILRAATG
jgi:predicted dinucleotide-binding enzyme